VTRNYVAVQAVLPHRPKFRRLSIPGRAALFTVWCDGTSRTPEAIWKSHAELADVLDLDGYGPDVLAELIASGWLDELDDGRLAIHDWDEHQVAYSRDVTRAYEAARKFDWRNRRTLPPTPPLREEGEVRLGKVRVSPNVPKRPGHVRDTAEPDGSGTTKRNGLEGPKDWRSVRGVVSTLGFGVKQETAP
jgi:hypothetical protein